MAYILYRYNKNNERKGLHEISNIEMKWGEIKPKYFDQLLGARRTQKLFKIHNSHEADFSLVKDNTGRDREPTINVQQAALIFLQNFVLTDPLSLPSVTFGTPTDAVSGKHLLSNVVWTGIKV